jgi:alpha-D-ribose 1-methylphosphonate 5-triphosphate synthase subunit PhnG
LDSSDHLVLPFFEVILRLEQIRKGHAWVQGTDRQDSDVFAAR